MPGLDALQSVQFISVKDQRFAVLSAEDWEALVEWLETVEDIEIAREMLSDLRSMNGDRLKAGWRSWEDVAKELD